MKLLHSVCLPLVFALPFVAPVSAEKVRVKGDNLTFKDLVDLNNKKISSADKNFQGKVVIVDIFGTWCPPCRAEIPHLVEFYNKYKSQGLEIVGISFEKEDNAEKRTEMVKEFVKKNNMTYTVLLGGMTADVKKVFVDQLENFSGFPTVIFIGRDGKVDGTEVGFPAGKGSEEKQKQFLEEFDKRIQKLLAMKTGAKKN